MYRNNENPEEEHPLTEDEKRLFLKIMNYFRTIFQAIMRMIPRA